VTEGDNPDQKQNSAPTPSTNENGMRKNEKIPIDVRTMLGTDEKKARFEKSKRVRWKLAVNISIVVGIAVIAIILLPSKSADGPTKEEIEKDSFIVTGSLDVLAELQNRYYRKHKRHASESELSAAFPVMRMYTRSIKARGYILEFQVSAESFIISARPAKPDPRRPAFEVSSSE